MVIGGISPMIGIAVVLILATAILVALNRRAVAARTASPDPNAVLRKDRPEPTAVSSWGDGPDWGASREWMWEDGSGPASSGEGTSPAAGSSADTTAPRAEAHLAAAAPALVQAGPSVPALKTGLPENAGTDPVRSVVQGLLDAQRDPAPEDLARLGLYRPERVLALAESLQDSLTARRDERKRERLAAIRRHLEALRSADELPRDEVATAADDPEDEPGIGRAMLSLVPEPDPPVATPPAIASDDDHAEQTAIAPQRTFAEDPALEPSQDVIEVLSRGDERWDSATITDDPFWRSPSAGVSSPEAAWDPVPATAAGDADEESWPDCLVVDPFAEITMRSSADDVRVPEDAPSAGPSDEEAAAAIRRDERSAAVTSVDDSWAATAPAEADEAAMAHTDGTDATSEATRDVEAVLASYRLGATPEEKRQAIDALAEQDSVLALAALQVCLDDPDPGIQLHALEAAEALLAR